MMSLNTAVGREAHSHEPLYAGSNIPPDTIQNQEEFKHFFFSLEKKSFLRCS